MKLMVFDVGGTEIKYAVIDENINISNKGYTLTPNDSLDSFLNKIYEIYSLYKDETIGIAMSLPGFIDNKTGMCNGGGSLLYNRNQNIKKLLEDKCNCFVHLENDGKAAALAELYKGSLKGTKNSAVFIIGTGVGGGLIIDGKLVRGKNSTAGEFSYINVNMSKQGDINQNIMANCCSVDELLRMYKEKTNNNEDIDGRQFFKRLDNDNDAKEVLDIFCKNIAIQISNLGILLNLEKVAIGGGISNQAILIETIKKQLDLLEINTFFDNSGYNPMKPEVVKCEFGSDANMVGALCSYLNE